MASQIQLRRDTAANWTSSAAVLAQGEAGFETDTGKVKFGDGTTAWASLPYFSNSFTVSQITDLTASAAELNVLDGITATTTELNYTDGVTSNIQTQLDAKSPLLADFVTDAGTARTLAASDANKTILFTSASAITLTVNASTDLPVGSRVDIVQDGAGVLTITADTATIAGAGTSTTSGSFTIGEQYSAATLLCVGSNAYRIIGNISAV
jgi:hypothetical protein